MCVFLSSASIAAGTRGIVSSVQPLINYTGTGRWLSSVICSVFSLQIQAMGRDGGLWNSLWMEGWQYEELLTGEFSCDFLFPCEVHTAYAFSCAASWAHERQRKTATNGVCRPAVHKLFHYFLHFFVSWEIV